MRPGDVEVPTGEVTELLQQLIRNACVNDGRASSGEEVRNADTLAAYLGSAGLDVERFDAAPGRTSLVARLGGTDPEAPNVCLMGHTDVVPVNPAGWEHDPFGGELHRGEVWGRGAVDMLNLTAAMAVVTHHLARDDARPRGDLIFFAVADEEAAGHHGAGYVCEHHWDAVACDYVLTENGGLVGASRTGGRHVTMNVAEKGCAWLRLVVRGSPGHGSMPYGADNAVIVASEVVRRLGEYRSPTELGELWRRRVDTMDVDGDLRAALSDPAAAYDAIASLPSRSAASHFHACTHTTFSPNVVHGGVKTNVIPDRVEIDLDCRTLPGETVESVHAHVRRALGEELADRVAIEPVGIWPSTASPPGTPMWDAMTAAARAHYPDATLLPGMIVGFTDARFFRERGAVAYGAGLASANLSAADFSARFHGHNERIDVESLALTTDFFLKVLDRLGA